MAEQGYEMERGAVIWYKMLMKEILMYSNNRLNRKHGGLDV
jgi:hypothetical protein